MFAYKDSLGDKVFSGHVLEAAKTQSIALINSVELYGIVCGVLSGRIKPEDFEHIREKAVNEVINVVRAGNFFFRQIVPLDPKLRKPLGGLCEVKRKLAIRNHVG